MRDGVGAHTKAGKLNMPKRSQRPMSADHVHSTYCIGVGSKKGRLRSAEGGVGHTIKPGPDGTRKGS